MRKNKEDRKEQKIRALYREYQDLWSYSVDSEVVQEPQVVDQASSRQEKFNAELASQLFEADVGEDSPPIYYTSRALLRKGGAAPFMKITEEEMRARSLHPYYEPGFIKKRTYRTETLPLQEIDLGPNEEITETEVWQEEDGTWMCSATYKKIEETQNGYVLKPKYREGWAYKGTRRQYYFDPEERSRRQEIRQRVEEISGQPFWAAVASINGDSPYRDPYWRDDREERRAEIAEREMEKEITEACAGIGGIHEIRTTKRGTHSFIEEEHGYGLMTGEDHKKAREAEKKRKENRDLRKRIREKDTARLDFRINGENPIQEPSRPDLFEKLNGSAEKLIELKNKLS